VTHNNSILYDYRAPEGLMPYLVLLPIGASVVASVITARWFIIDLLHQQADEPSDVLGLLFATFLLLVFGCIFLPFLNMYPSLRVSTDGLSIQVFLFWWIWVPWEGVLDIQPTISPVSRSSLVILRRLTPVHRCIGLVGGLTLKPAFLIKRTLRGYHEALGTIREHVS
jgi:hypothetical protein